MGLSAGSARGSSDRQERKPAAIRRSTVSSSPVWKRKAGARPPADKRTLLRRATFDLTGLPPTPEEIDAFLKDDSPDAFAKVVDRLLASPRYGERWGRHWLDVVRYADYHDGNPKARNGQLRTARSLALSRLGRRRRSIATCPSTSSSSIRSPATCCPSPDGQEILRRRADRDDVPRPTGPGTVATPTRKRWSATWSMTRSTRSARRSWA